MFILGVIMVSIVLAFIIGVGIFILYEDGGWGEVLSVGGFIILMLSIFTVGLMLIAMGA